MQMHVDVYGRGTGGGLCQVMAPSGHCAVGSGEYKCAGGQEAPSMASRVSKEVRDALTLHPSGFTVGHTVGFLHPLPLFVTPTPTPLTQLTSCGIYTRELAPVITGVQILPGLQWGLIMRLGC